MLNPTPQKICQDLCTWHNALNLGKSQIDFEQFKRYNVELHVSACSRICAHFPEISRASTKVINIFWNYSKSNKYYYNQVSSEHSSSKNSHLYILLKSKNNNFYIIWHSQVLRNYSKSILSSWSAISSSFSINVSSSALFHSASLSI